jgi:hypothetical protein
MNQLNQQQLIQLIEQWQQTNPSIYKTNLKRICDSKNIKPRQLEKLMQVNYNTARSYTNAVHPARIEFITALKLANMLGLA